MAEENGLNGQPDWLDEVVERLREPVERAPGAVDSVMRALLESGAGAARDADPARQPAAGRVWGWLTRPRLSVSPLSAGGWSLALVAMVVLAVRAPFTPAPTDSPAGVHRHQFVLVAPNAASVGLAGDFNGWDPAATPLIRQGDAWTVELELEPGRHVYSFVIDGVEWVSDADAPRAPEDDFGRPSSVLLVGRGT